MANKKEKKKINQRQKKQRKVNQEIKILKI